MRSKGFFRSIRAFAIADLLILAHLCGLSVAQSTEAVLYNFGAYPGDGMNPNGGLVADQAGNLYGVTSGGGAHCQSQGGCGTVYELSPASGGNWTETILYSFCPTEDPPVCPDGSVPGAGLIMASSGNLYGTTDFGGSGEYGTVFQLSPPQNGVGSWTENVLWNFAANKKNNGYRVGLGKLNMDTAGNLYGTTQSGGAQNKGIVFQLSPAGNGTFTFSILHSFSGPDGADPQYGVAIDNAGNLYGTTEEGGKSNSICSTQCGLVYELSQLAGKWKEKVLYEFNGTNGANPISPISIDTSGSLYGTFVAGGQGSCLFFGCGGAFKLVPGGAGQGKAYTFFFNGQSGGSPMGGLLVARGQVFGTTAIGAGNVFTLRGESLTVLYQFCSLPNCTDGRQPSTGTLLELHRTLYGVTNGGGLYNNSGVLYSITP